MTVSHIAEVAALLAVSYAVGLLVGMLARRLVTRQGSKPVAVVEAAAVAAAPVDTLAVATPVAALTADPEVAVAPAASAQGQVIATDVPGARVQVSEPVDAAPTVAATSAEPAPITADTAAASTEKIEPPAEIVTPPLPPAPTVVGPIVVDDALVPFDPVREPQKPAEAPVAPPPPSQEEILAGLASVAAKAAMDAITIPESGAVTADASSVAPIADALVAPAMQPEEPVAAVPVEATERPVQKVTPPMQPDDLIAALSAVVPAAEAVEPVVETIKAPVSSEPAPPVVEPAEPPAATVVAEATLPELPLATTVSIGGTAVQPESVAKAPEAIVSPQPVPAEVTAPVETVPPVAVAPVETPKPPTPPIATVPSNFDDLLTQLTSIAAKARAVRDGGNGDAGSAGTAGGSARPAASAGARPARVPGFAWGGTIRGRSASVYVAKAGPLQPTSTVATPPASPPTPRATAPVSERKAPPVLPAATPPAPPPVSRPQVSDASVRAALFESIASELDVALPTPVAPAPAPAAAAPPQSAPVQVSQPPVDEPPVQVTPVPPSAPAAMDEDDAMRAIEGGWSRTRARALGGTPEIADLGAAVSAAQIAVETVLARNGIDPGQGAASVKPKGLAKPRNGKRDNLQSIKGVGALDEIALNNLGIFHYDQVAEWDQKTILWLENHAFARGRIAREEWQAQARALLGDVGDLKVSR